MSSAGAALREVFEGIAGEKGLAVLIRAYFDESDEGTSDFGFFTVAGYVFNGSGLRELEKKWRAMLKKYRLPYFHMAECNAANPKPDNVFSHLSEQERIQAATDAIAIARKYPLHGAAYLLRREDYREVLEDNGFDCDPYSFMLWSALIHVGKWKDQNKPQQSLSLFFEQGYSTQSRANELLQYAIQDKALRRGGPGIISHSFFDKDCSYPGQAADLLAWNVRKGNANVYAGKPLRGDTRALIEGRITKTVFFDRKRLTLLSEDFVKKCGSLAVASRQLFTRNPAASEGLERYS